MKTKNNVQKAILRSAAVVISFVLISFTVSAQDFWKRLLENSSFNEIALAMVETSNEMETTEPTESFDFNLLEQESEQALNLEDWMMDNNFFGVSELEVNEVNEKDLEVEAWMLDESLFNVEKNNGNEMELESWMTSDKLWAM